MRLLCNAVVAFAAPLLAGCGGSTSAPAGGVTPGEPAAPVTPAANLPRADDLNYRNWKKYPVGTTVVRRKVSTNPKEPDKQVVETTTLSLIEATDARVAVQQQITVEKTGYPTEVNPPMTAKYTPTFAVPEGMKAEAMQAPDLKAKVTGEETVTVLGNEYKATVYEWMGSTESGPMPIKLWLSDDVPGRQVKAEYKLDKGGSLAREEVVEIKRP